MKSIVKGRKRCKIYVNLESKKRSRVSGFVIRQILAALAAGKILANHQRYLKDDSMVKFAQIQTGELLDLLQAVHQGIAVYEQLTGSFGNVQIVFKEFIDGEQRLLIQRINGVLLEHFAEENLAEGGGQLINQTADTQIFIAHDALFRIENLANVNCGLRFLIGV